MPLRDPRELEAAGIRWRGAYEELRPGWGDDMDANPWSTRNVLEVGADDSDAAKEHVATALGRAEAAGDLSAEESRPAL